MVDVRAGETVADIPLDHAEVLRAVSREIALLLDLYPGDETVDAHFRPDRPIEVTGTLQVTVPPR